MQVKSITLEHSAILLTFIKLPFVINIFVLSILSGRFTQILLYIHSKPENEFTGMNLSIDFNRQAFAWIKPN